MPALSDDLLRRMHDYWCAANYLTVGQIYLCDNPLLEEPLADAHIKQRLLGHWGTTAGLNFIYTHLNRAIRQYDLDMIYVIGPGHGGPGLVAHTYLEGSYTEVYPHISRDRAGLRQLFRQFSWPYGVPSHVAPETPGSIHEGGELGYALSHAYGAAFDNPGLIVSLRRRRRRGGNRAGRDRLAFQQVHQSGARRRGAADPALERLQDRQPDRARPHSRARADPALQRLRPCADRGGRR
jgi:phosphoketolase